MSNSSEFTNTEGEFKIVIQSEDNECNRMSIRVNDFSNLIISSNIIAHIHSMMCKDVDIDMEEYQSEEEFKELKTKLTISIINQRTMVHVYDEFLIQLGRDDETSPYYATIISHDNSIEGFNKLNECMKKLKSESRISQESFIAYNDLGIDSY